MRHSISLILIFQCILNNYSSATFHSEIESLAFIANSENESILSSTDSLCEGNVYISTQDEYDQFIASNGECRNYTGDITIDNVNAEIDSLYGLDSLRLLVGDLIIENGEGNDLYFNVLNYLDSVVGDINISNFQYHFNGLNNVRFADDVTLSNTSINYGDSCLSLLSQCSSILLYTGISAGQYQNAFNNLVNCQKIQIIGDLTGTGGYAGNSFMNLLEVDTILVRNGFLMLVSCFQNLRSAGYIEIGAYGQYLGAAVELFSSLEQSGSISLSTNGRAPELSSLRSVNDIFIEEVTLNIESNHNILCSLEHVSGNAIFALCRDTIEFPQLVSVGDLTIVSAGDINDVGSQAILLPSLDSVYQNFFVWSKSFFSESGYNTPPTNCVFLAPQLSFIGGGIALRLGSNFTTCESPAFCPSYNYSPNWFEISGGPNCSSLQEIQAQCDAPCADIDLNGICDSVQTVYEGDMVFITTSEIESFANAFPNVHKIIGDLTLSGYSGDAMLKTEALINLDTIQGLLSYSIAEGYAFSGFANLRHVDSLVGSAPYYDGGIIYNELDSLPIYDYCTNCFPSLLSVKKMLIPGPNEFAFNSLVQCDTLIIFGTNMTGAFPSLERCNVLSINTSFTTGYPEHNYFDMNLLNVIGTPLLINEYLQQYEFFSYGISNSFNQLDTLDCFFSTDAEISQSFNDLKYCRTMYFNDVIVHESISNLDSCKNLFSYGNSRVIHCFENITSLNYLAVYSNETLIHFPSVRRLGWGDFHLIDDADLQFNQLDSIIVGIYVDSKYGWGIATHISMHLPELDYCGLLIFLGVDIVEFTTPDFITCRFINAQDVYGLESLKLEMSLDTNLPENSICFPLVLFEWFGINIAACPDYSQCSLPGICSYCQENYCWFSGNGPGCSSNEEAFLNCQGSTASGTVFYDLDCNQQFDAQDVPVSFPIMLVGDTIPIGTSGNDGQFSVPLEQNSTISLHVQHTQDWTVTNGPTIINIGDSFETVSDIVVGLCPISNQHNLSVQMNASIEPQPGFTVRYFVIAHNLWPGSDSALVHFDSALMPGALITGYSNGGQLEENVISFPVSIIYAQPQALWVDVMVPIGTPLGTIYSASASINYADNNTVDNHPENNSYTLNQTVIGSYNSNNKIVNPTTIDLLDIDSTQTEWLEYTIRFQNTGTAEAIFVRVLDTLSQAFDITSFELIATSHPCEVIFRENRSVEWYFDNIMLPDSFTNEPESHGYIQFRIRTNELASTGALDNEAGIYFDFNEPVQTPSAFTHLVICDEQGSPCDDNDPCTTSDIFLPDCTCAGTFADSDNDGTCDANDLCAGSESGTACDDYDPCTMNDIIQSNCTCAGTFADTDNDGSCDANDLCEGPETGSACDDNNPCTVNDLIQSDCTCAGSFADGDSDGTCDANDLCAGPEAGNACDDSDACTINDVIQSDCTCAGTFADGDNDGTCDANDLCTGPEAGTACDDNDACTINDAIQSDCTCVGTFADGDGDSTCDANDFCVGPEAGTACDDNDTCTINDVIQSDCTCAGTFADTDSDGTCDANDNCAGPEAGTVCDDNDPCTTGDIIIPDCSCAGTFADADNDGTCDANDLCAGPEAGTACDDNDPCTTGDVILADCSCAGTFADADNDGTCDANDNCAGAETGTACDDNDPCTTGDIILADCSCAGTFADADNDGTCDANDVCEGPEPGSSCDDGDPCTTNDVVQSDCSCRGTAVEPQFSSVTAHACGPYAWNNNTYSQSGTYQVTLQNATGCDSIAQLVLTIGAPTTSSESATACGGYTWNGTTYSQSGAYTFMSTNASGCPNTATLNLTVNSLSVAPTGANASQTSVNAGTQVTLTVQGGSLGTGAAWKWYRSACGGSLIGTGASITITANATDFYFVRAEGTCNTTTCASVAITVLPSNPCGPQSVSANATAICAGASTTLSVQGSLSSGASWKWYRTGCGSSAVGTGASITVAPTTTTTYFVRSEGGSCGITSCMSITITVNTAPGIPQGIVLPAQVCRNSPSTISVLNPVAGTSYFWQVPNSWTITGGQGTATIQVMVGQGNGQIRVYAFNSCGNSKNYIRSVSPINCNSASAMVPNDMRLDVWPNPTSDRVYFAYDEQQPDILEIFDMMGRSYYNGGWIREFDTSALTSGIYFVRITRGEESLVKRMEVVR